MEKLNSSAPAATNPPAPPATSGESSIKLAAQQSPAEKKHQMCHSIIVNFLTKFYGGTREVARAIAGGQLWDLRKTARGLTAEMYNLNTREIKIFAIPVSSHAMQMQPAAADSVYKSWRELVDTGDLRK